ncbi:hypothetical protein CPB85DRAFT_1431209 [Mucidula mucida]|nr:hypothetical protein CPB85DRAFT_1431209 [Mucidula mucida]
MFDAHRLELKSSRLCPVAPPFLLSLPPPSSYPALAPSIYIMAAVDVDAPSSNPDDAPQWGLDMEHRILWSIHSLRVNVAIGRFEREQHASWAAKRYLNSAAVDAQDPIYALELPSPPISIINLSLLLQSHQPQVYTLIPKTMDALNNLSGLISPHYCWPTTFPAKFHALFRTGGSVLPNSLVLA